MAPKKPVPTPKPLSKPSVPVSPSPDKFVYSDADAPGITITKKK